MDFDKGVVAGSYHGIPYPSILEALYIQPYHKSLVLEMVTIDSNLMHFVLHCLAKKELTVARLALDLLPINVACYSLGFLRQFLFEF